jgi:hypothetical protein
MYLTTLILVLDSFFILTLTPCFFIDNCSALDFSALAPCFAPPPPSMEPCFTSVRYALVRSLQLTGTVSRSQYVNAELILHFLSPTDLELWLIIFWISRFPRKIHKYIHQVYESGESFLYLAITR